MKKLALFIVFAVTFMLRAAVGLPEAFDWSGDNVKTLCPGIQYVKLEYNSPRIMKVAAVRIDLKTPGLRFKVTGRAENWGKPMPDYSKPEYAVRTLRVTTRKFMEQSVKDGDNMVVAVNGAPWAPWKMPWNHRYADKMRLLVSDGVLVSPPLKGDRPSFVVDKSGKCSFATIREGDDISHIRQAISGFVTILKDGKLIIADEVNKLAPRTGYGLDSECRYLYLFVVDGRQKGYSMGCSVYETGQFLKYFGAAEAVNMDGGGSTTLLLRDRDEIIKLNHQRGNAERTVGASMGIIIDKQSAK